MPSMLLPAQIIGSMFRGVVGGDDSPGAGADDLLLETGDHLLLETGDALLLE